MSGPRVEPTARRVPTVELLRHFSEYGDETMTGPIVVTKNGRDRFVLLTLKQYRERGLTAPPPPSL